MSEIEDLHRRYYWAIEDGDIGEVLNLFQKHGSLRQNNRELDPKKETWISVAIELQQMAILKKFISIGYDVNALELPGGVTPLERAIGKALPEYFSVLLTSGANPNLGRPLIAAMGSKHSPEQSCWYISELIKHGADVNRLYELYGDKNALFSALDWAPNEQVRQLLLKHGAKSSKELLQSKESRSTDQSKDSGESKPPPSNKDNVKTVIQFFLKNFGAVEKQSIIEIVSDDHPITIHIIKPTKDRDVLTLFTTGMSHKPMSPPPESRGSRLAELFIQLPGNWPITNFKDPAVAWPLVWLKRLAKYPAANDAWLEYPITVMSDEDNDKIAAGLPFDSFLLFAEHEAQQADGNRIQLYRLLPLYPKERILEAKKGAPALLRAFDQAGVSFICDPKRKCAVK
jgi:hypothetical protein